MNRNQCITPKQPHSPVPLDEWTQLQPDLSDDQLILATARRLDGARGIGNAVAQALSSPESTLDGEVLADAVWSLVDTLTQARHILDRLPQRE